jgi:hypothetical protein
MDKGRKGNSTVVELRPTRSYASEEIIRLVDDLRRVTMAILTTRLTTMFDGADDLLFEFAERAANNGEQRLYFDTMRTVRLGRPEMLQRFAESLARGFEAQLASDPTAAVETEEDEFSLQDSSTLEKDIAISNMASKAEGLYKQALWEIGRKLVVLVKLHHAPMQIEALSPQSICDAFRSGAEALKVELGIELVIYKLFDRLVIGELGELYAKVLHLLKQSGIQAAMPVSAPPPAPFSAPASVPSSSTPSAGPTAAYRGTDQPGGSFPQAGSYPTPGGYPATGGMPEQAGAVGPAALPGWSQAIASMAGSFAGGFGPVFGSGTSGPGAGTAGAPQQLDPQTLNALKKLEAADRAPAQFYYGNAQLAADLADAARGRPIAGWAPGQAAAYVQRTGLVGQMFNDILSDPHLPESLRMPFDTLRLSVIKTALDDPQFIADPAHPVRSLVNELGTIAAAARTAESESLRRIERLVDEIRSQFEVAAESVRASTASAKPVAPEDAERFVEQQGAQAEVRRLAMIKKVRRIVAEELQLRTLGLSLPLEVRPLIYSAWAPMMSVHLLRGGPEGIDWRNGLAQLEAVLAALDPASEVATDVVRRTVLIEGLRKSFAAVGLVESRIDLVLAGLAKALDGVHDAGRTAGTATETASAASASSAETLTDHAPDLTTAAAAVAAAVKPAARTPEANRALLDLLIVPGAWFRIFDRDRQCSRWLKAVALYPGMDCAAFAEFNGKNTLLVKASLLLDDLAARRAEPLDVSPATRRALQEFLEATGREAA